MNRLVGSLERFPDVLAAALSDVEAGEATWRPADGGWSVLEIARHLLDEETLDFRTRLRLTLEDPASPWPPIDPPGWVAERRYNEDDLAQTLARFREERAASVAWLRSLRAPEWSRRHEHPSLGPLSAGDLLASWASHDCLHLRQLGRRRHELLQRAAEPYGGEYAGPLA